jgi:hypothetical protein
VPGSCVQCGYDLTAHEVGHEAGSVTCPECGRAHAAWGPGANGGRWLLHLGVIVWPWAVWGVARAVAVSDFGKVGVFFLGVFGAVWVLAAIPAVYHWVGRQTEFQRGPSLRAIVVSPVVCVAAAAAPSGVVWVIRLM